jgi:hypothetical protein
MGDGGAAHGEFAEEGLHVADGGRAFGTCGGIADMADGQFAGQGVHHIGLGEVVADIAEAAGRVEALFRIVGNDPACFLSAMLQRMQAEGHEGRGIGHADDAEHAAFLLQLVVIEGVGERKGRMGPPNPGEWMGVI